MVEHALREGTAGSGGTESLGETEGLADGKVGLHHDEGSSGNGLFSDNDTSSGGEALVDTTDGVFGALDLDEEDGFLEARGGEELRSVHDTSGGGDELTTTSVDSIGMEGNILDVESDTSHVLFDEDTFLGGPVEGSLHGVLNFVKVLDGLGGINKEVRSGSLGSEAPNLESIIGVPLELVSEDGSAGLGVLLAGNLLVFDGLGELVTEGFADGEDSVMLVGGLGERLGAGLLSDSLFVGDNGVTLLDGALGKLFLEILKADFDMELTTSSDDVLTGLLSGDNDEGVGLGELSESFNELGEIGGRLDFDGNTHDGGDRVFHDSDVVSEIAISDGTLLEEVLVNTDESDGVTTRDIGDGFGLSSHHEDGSLDVLNVEVDLGSGSVVGSHDSDLLAGGGGTSENTTESEESSLIVGGDHLGDENHEGTGRVTLGDGLTARIFDGSLVEVSGSVSLGLQGGRKLQDDHLNESIGGVNPLLEDALEEGLTFVVLLVTLEDDTETDEHLVDDGSLAFHGVSAELDDGLHDEFDEASSELSTLAIIVNLDEFLLSGAEVVISPKLTHELLSVELELVGVSSGEHGEGEGPSEEGGTESDGTVGGVNLLSLSHVFSLVGGDDNVSVLNNTLEVLVHGLTINLEFEDTSVDLVNEEDGLNLLSESLSEDGLGLDADTFDVIDNDESSVSDTEGSGDFGREINVTGGVDQVDQVLLGVLLVDDISLVVERDTGGLNSNSTLLLVSTGVSVTGVTRDRKSVV